MRLPTTVALCGLLLLAGTNMPAPQGPGRDPQHRADMEVFHFLLDHRNELRRQVKHLPNGVETLTESDNPKITAKIQEHVAAMKKRVEERRPIHARDPLFRELFRNAKTITLHYEKTPKGVKVTETSTDPFVAKLIQAHAEVVNLFVKNGHAEMRKDHPVPEKK